MTSSVSRNSLEIHHQPGFPGNSFREFQQGNNNLNWYDNSQGNYCNRDFRGMPLPPPLHHGYNKEFRSYPEPSERIYQNPLPENASNNYDFSDRQEGYLPNRLHFPSYEQDINHFGYRCDFNRDEGGYFVSERKKFRPNPSDNFRWELNETRQVDSKDNALRAVYEELHERANSPPKHLPPDISAAPKRSILKKTSSMNRQPFEEGENFLYDSSNMARSKNFDTSGNTLLDNFKQHGIVSQRSINASSNSTGQFLNERPKQVSSNNQVTAFQDESMTDESVFLKNIFDTINYSPDVQKLVEIRQKRKLVEKDEFKIQKTSSTFMDGGLINALEAREKFTRFLPEDGETYEDRARKYKEGEKEREKQKNDKRLPELKRKFDSRKTEEKINQSIETSDECFKDPDFSRDELTTKEIKIDPADKNRLLEKHKERIRQLELAELELKRCRRTQLQWMRKKQRSKEGVDESIISENERLQKSMINRINQLRKEADDLSRRIGLEDVSEMRTTESDKKSSNFSGEDQIKRKKMKSEYDYIDSGNHWCRLCNTVSENVYELFNHLKTKEHAENADPFDRPWLSEQITNQKSEKKKNSVTMPFKGYFFLIRFLFNSQLPFSNSIYSFLHFLPSFSYCLFV